MGKQRVSEGELNDGEKGSRDRLLAYFGRSGEVISHRIYAADERARRPQREFVAVVKQDRDERLLILVGCPLGSPPWHEGGASMLGDYEKVLATLDARDWSAAEKRAIRAFIAADDEATAEKAKPRRRRGKRKRD